uniref:EOG090X0GY7 n=1 Tax=Eubosmina coregoni TaxID=186181 RepID=A0A4Y7LLT0_9CRUS|nr:EOG090X0GY7 [Eubosmina coregoni]SVE70147.1 EOG090X0GY7 [Eubosmina coregoni]
MAATEPVDIQKHRYPFSIVWTPIPLITWIFPFIGHMGIATSAGVIRDFAGSYFVSEDHMGFGNPTKYWQLDITKVPGGVLAWDRAVQEASDEYKNHMHNLFCDNCHSHCALAMNTMAYPGKRNWNMVSLCWQLLVSGRHASFGGFIKTWLPSVILYSIIAFIVVFLS